MHLPRRPAPEKVILIFGTLHLVFLLLSMLPNKWRDGTLGSELLHGYERITRCHQEWTMFETIPTMHRLEARLVVKDGAQKARAEGVVLPGLRQFSQQDQVRLNNWMVSVVFQPSRSVFRESYMRSAAAALLRTRRYSPQAQVSLEVVPSYTRSLLGVRKLREIAVERPSVLGPFELGTLVSAAPPTN